MESKIKSLAAYRLQKAEMNLSLANDLKWAKVNES